MDKQDIPEGKVLRDDGCICPAEVIEAPPEKKKKELKMGTCPYDPRFPHTNITKRCYLSFVDYQRCARLLGEYPGCLYFLRCYLALCPTSWQERWFTQMENGTFPYTIYPPKPIIRPDRKASQFDDLKEDDMDLGGRRGRQDKTPKVGTQKSSQKSTPC